MGNERLVDSWSDALEEEVRGTVRLSPNDCAATTP